MLSAVTKYQFLAYQSFKNELGGWEEVRHASLVQYYYHGSTAIFAVYRYGARELPFVNGLFEGLGLGIIPSLIKNRKDGLFQLRKNTLHLLHLVFPITIILMSCNTNYPIISLYLNCAKKFYIISSYIF